MSWLSKAVRKNRGGLRRLAKKAGKQLLGNVARVAAGVVTGGQSEAVIRAAKGIGALARKGRRNKSEAAVLAKAMAVQPPKVVPISAVRASTMPGGAPLKGIRVVRRRPSRGNIDLAKIAKRERASERRAHAAARPRKTARKARSGAKRSPPKGGKDFKALSALWKAAGKPGTWRDWVKSH